MKLKRFVAADMRSALAKIKEELGAEAVIMSNKRVANGVEIIAGVETKTVSVEELSTTADNDSITSKVLKEDSPLSRIIKDDEVTLTSSGRIISFNMMISEWMIILTICVRLLRHHKPMVYL